MNLPDRRIASDVDHPPVDPRMPENQRAVVLGALRVLSEAKKFDVVVQSPEDSLVMPDKDQFYAGDTTVTLTPLHHTQRAMLELQVEPLLPNKEYRTIVTIAFREFGIRLDKDSMDRIVVVDTEEDSVHFIKGSGALRAQAIMLERAARGLRLKAESSD